MSEEMDRRIRAAAGYPPAGGDPGQALDLERAAELAERLGCTVREAIDLMAGYRSGTPPSTPAGNAGAGTGAQPPAAPDMNKLIRRAAGLK